MNMQYFGAIALGALFVAAVSGGAFAGETKDYEDPGYSFQSSPFRFSAGLREGFDDNVNTSHENEIESWFTSAYAEITADLSNPRTQFSIGIGGGATYYYDVPNDDVDYNGKFKLALIHRFSPRVTLEANSLVIYQAQPIFEELGGIERRDGQYLYTTSRVGLTYQWTPKFQTVTHYTFAAVDYENSFESQINDRIENYIGQEFAFLISPVTTLIGEYRFGIVNYRDNTINDSTSNYILAGIDHTFSPKLNTSIRAGAEIRNSDAMGTKGSPYGEASVSYIYSQYSSIELNARYGFESGNLVLSNERRTFRTGVKLNHGFTPKLSVFSSLFYNNNQYDGTLSYHENVLSASAGLRYALSRNWTLETAYNYTQLWSDEEILEYDRNRYTIGGVFSF
jgi:opacity protein-like surface antigen